ncbi:MAG: ABC transporter permease [Phycisphaerae bacterium]|nr:ABC transporter permease [Phycisphaerae bacterium]
MRNLMWKDLRQNRNLLLAVGVILGVIYLLPLLVFLAMGLLNPFQRESWRRLLESLTVSSFIAVWVTVLLMLPAIACSLITGERADRTSQFAAYLPIPRGKAVASRFAVAILCSLAFLLLSGLVCLGCVALTSSFYGRLAFIPNDLLQVARVAATICLLMFGLACFWSSLLSSPVQAVLAVLGTAAVLATVFLRIHDRPFAAYGVAPVLGLVSACVGAWICHRRLVL